MKCAKIKNPCKICFQSVSKKNGLQCQGACKKWAHYKCLNYTPGKIQDIKAGLIEVTCPCPDCNIAEPKEKLVDPPFTCTNTQCTANKLPVCTSVECPSNENPIPTYPPPHFEYSPAPSPPRSSSSHRPIKCSLIKTSSPPKFPTKRKPPQCDARTSNRSPSASPPNKTTQKIGTPCPLNCPSQQQLSKPKRKICTPKQSKSCSNLSNSSSITGKQQFENLRTISSDSQVPNIGVDQKMLYTAIENLCNTVGQLSNQLRALMCKMKENIV